MKTPALCLFAALAILPPAAITAEQSRHAARSEEPPGGRPAIRLVRDENIALEELATARRLAAAKQLSAAEQHYLKALANAPEHPEILFALARLSEQTGRPDDARQWARRALRGQPDDAATVAAALPFLPPAEAAEQLQRALREHPDSAALLFHYGNRHAEGGHWPEAAKAYLSAAALAPEQGALWFNAGVALEHLKRAAEAAACYRRALAAAEHSAPGFEPEIAARRLDLLKE